MKRHRKYEAFIFIFFFIICAEASHAQQLNLKDLNVPNSPAFILLDKAPAVIERPGTTKAFTASIVSLVTEGSGLPKNFGFEITPFWFFKNNLDVYKYLGIDRETGKQKNIFANLRHASISAGSFDQDSTKSHPYDANYFSFGFRANPVSVVRKQMSSAINDVISAIALRQVALTPSVVTGCTAFIGQPQYNACLAKGLEAAFGDDKAIQLQEDRLRKLLSMKPAFQVDIAAAGSLAFRDNTVGDHHGDRTGIWTTLAYNLPLSGTKDLEKLISNKNYMNFYVAFRYLQEKKTKDFVSFTSSHSIDFGGRFEFQLDKLSVSFESLHRFEEDNHDTNRNVGILQYRIMDNLFLTGSFGKNFGSVNNLVALFGINWGFGNELIKE
ncbi:MAG: hypothetical protein ACJ75F_08340 [Flavisolibacter sp.]